MATAAVPVELGFVEKRTPWKLRSKYFVSKVGGCPAWLRLNNLPDRSDMLCKTCGKSLIFLLQVYAPIPEVQSAFHRTIFLFMCANGKCYKRFDNQNFVVYRSQLPRENEFYSFDPPDYNEKTSSDPSAEKYQPLCCLCGCVASIKCSKCSEADYCSEDHRDCDWKWNHQSVCGKNSTEAGAKRKKATNQFLLPEYELVTETEELPSTGPEKSDEEKMTEYRQFMQSAKAPKEMQDMPLDDLDAVMKKNDKAFNKFQKRIKLEPEQVFAIIEENYCGCLQSMCHLQKIFDCVCGAKRCLNSRNSATAVKLFILGLSTVLIAIRN
ncbi:Programmed cell death protein 2 [Araneus ventricosus]|uniref:Programmed cell death protein 2 n=1 Tax=Araneus ventricosus TaxID=182803 RepID=A0A4Y2PU96_ARAVE|nr:Programmed cell death protein 2 [Araneus ventricosus]